MKKSNILMLSLLAILLVGCSSKNAEPKNSDVEKSSQTSVKKDKDKNKDKSTSSRDDKKDDVNSSQDNSTTGTTEQLSRLEQLNQSLRQNLGQIPLPQVDGLGYNHDKVNVRYIGNENDYSIYYSLGYNAYPFNDEALKTHVPYATLIKSTYASKDEARQAIQIYDQNQATHLPAVDLGYQIEGTLDSGAGQSYLQWREGNWSLYVHASAYNGQNTIPTGQAVVKLLEQYMLPIPDDQASLTVDLVADHTTLKWMKGNVVYTLEGKDYNALIPMAASIK